MGGVGKTELATQYARRHENDYSGGICWINARSGNIAAQIIQFAFNLGLQVPQKDFEDKPLGILEQIKWCWQNWQPSEGFVLIVLDDINDLEGFSELIPTNNRFRILITTRLRNLDTNIQEIPLNVLSAEEALELLVNLIGEKRINKSSRHCEEERRSNRNNSLEEKNIEIASLRRNDTELTTAKELCKWLGYLPLGIELVGRYLVKKPPHFTLKKMLEQLNQQRLHQEAMNPQHRNLSTAQLGVLAAFELSWVELNPQTQQVARLLSLFAADIFEWEWVESTFQYFKKIKPRKLKFQRFISFLMPWRKNINQFQDYTDSDIQTAIEQLYQRHLVQILAEGDKHYYKIHPLIREFLKTKLTADSEINDIKQAFTSTFIEIAQTIPNSATLEFINSVKNAIPHLKEVAENLIDAVSDENLYWAFTGLARFYQEQGLYALAEPWFQRYVSVVRSRLGENHPHLATSLNNLAQLYNFQGRYKEAEPLLIQALELKKQLLGENHPHLATSLNNLAELYRSQGRYEAAEPLYIQALELYKQLLGENHPNIAMSLNNLALLYYSQGKYKAAEPLYIQALELYKQLLGENHPDVAMSLNNLAALYYSQGKYEAAEPLHKQALELRKQLLGENHPNVATSLDNLAALYNSQGKYEAAEPLYIQALELRKQLLGENHPHLATSLNNLANLYYSQERYEAAEPLLIQALELSKQLLGENHPHIATSLNNLAGLYSDQGRYKEAEPLLIQALELYKQLLGENHPHIATSLDSLAILYYSQGKYEAAEPLYIQALELYKQLLGENHPDVAQSLNNLAGLYYFQGKYEAAEPLYIQALQLCEQSLGVAHPKTITVRGNYAVCLREMSQKKR